ncbi:MAG: hypothetical protein EPN33_05085 [Acidobacteria bacterium]|nr:MAG: hypothetical protein EPN33_05085 [Acidobacteriota bacterium]
MQYVPDLFNVGNGFDLLGAFQQPQSVATWSAGGSAASGSSASAAGFGTLLGGAATGAGHGVFGVFAAAKWYCGPSPHSRILKSIAISSAAGAILGGVAGFTAGEMLGGVFTMGVSGAPGAALGILVGTPLGAMRGAEFGVLSAAACKGLGFYN